MLRICLTLIVSYSFISFVLASEEIDNRFYSKWFTSLNTPWVRLILSSDTGFPRSIAVKRNEKGHCFLNVPYQTGNNEVDKIAYSIRYKSNNATMRLVFSVLTNNGDMLKVFEHKSDIHSNDNGLMSDVFHLSNPNSAFLHTEIFVDPINDKDGSFVSFDRFDITVNDTCIAKRGDFIPQSPNLSPESLVDLSRISYRELPIMNTRILGVGETFHGTEDLNRLAFDIMRERVRYKNNRLLLAELPMSLSLQIDAYINQQIECSKSELRSLFEDYLISDSIVEFIEWLRDYNMTQSRKIHFLGFDVSSDPGKTTRYLMNYLSKRGVLFNDSMKQELSDLQKEKQWNELFDVLKTDQKIQMQMSDSDYQLFRYALDEYIYNQESSQSALMKARESYMYRSTSRLLDLLLDKKEERCTIFAHVIHLWYGGMLFCDLTNNFTSTGGKLKQVYLSDYACIALSAVSGSFYHSYNKSIDKMEELPETSIEYQIGCLGEKPYYIPLSKEYLNNLIQFRLSGLIVGRSQFGINFLKRYADGMIVIPKVEFVKKAETKIIHNNDSLERSNSFMELIKTLN